MKLIRFGEWAGKLTVLGIVAASFCSTRVVAQSDFAGANGERPLVLFDKDSLREFKPPQPLLSLPAEDKKKIVQGSGESARDSEVDTSNKNEIMIWGGYSPDSTTALPFAGSRDARFGILGVKYARRFNNSPKYNFKYTAEVYPVSALNFLDNGTRKTEYAFGFSPFGVQLNFRPRKKFQPFIGAAGGALIFSKSIPNELGTKFNFTADLSAGLEIRVQRNQSVSLGYKLFHISNAGLGRINPSFDNNVFFAGYSYLF